VPESFQKVKEKVVHETYERLIDISRNIERSQLAGNFRRVNPY